MIDTTKYTAHLRPGKFEGENPATEYFYSLTGEGETVYLPSAGDEDTDGEPIAECFMIDAEESEAFGIPLGHYYLIREDSQGFVIGSVHPSREACERAFAGWCGLELSGADAGEDAACNECGLSFDTL